MEAFSASSLELTDAALLGGGDDARDLTVADGAGGIRRSLRFLRRNLFWTVVVTLVAILVGGLAYLQTWPPLAVVQSGSMVPTIQIGDVVVLKHLDGPPRVGQIVVVHVPDAARSRYGYPPVVTHRVYRISRGMVTTKGDALKVPDPFQTPINTINERVVAVIPNAGRVYGFFTSTWGMLWLAVGALMLLGMPLLERHREREDAEQATIAGLHSQLETIASELAGRSELPAGGAGGAASGVVETRLRALVERAASAEQTLAGATAALEHQRERLTREPFAAGSSTPTVVPAEPEVTEVPAAVSWSWALAAAAATVVGCRLRGRNRGSRSPAASWAWPSSKPAPPPAPPLKPLAEVLSAEAKVLSAEAINRLNSSETVTRISSGSSETLARIASSEALAALRSGRISPKGLARPRRRTDGPPA